MLWWLSRLAIRHAPKLSLFLKSGHHKCDRQTQTQQNKPTEIEVLVQSASLCWVTKVETAKHETRVFQSIGWKQCQPHLTVWVCDGQVTQWLEISKPIQGKESYLFRRVYTIS